MYYRFLHERKFKIADGGNFWVMDGTFDSCPLPFCQIYTIHAIDGAPEGTNKVAPLAYALLSHKSER